MFSLTSPVTVLGKLNKNEKLALRNLNIETVKDLLYHFPFRYVEYGEICKIADLVSKEVAAIEASVSKINSRRGFNRRLSVVEATLTDGSGYINAIWFNQPYVVKNIKVGDIFRFSGRLAYGKYGRQLSNPRYENPLGPRVATAPFTPVYALAAGLSQTKFRKLVFGALHSLATTVPPPSLKLRRARPAPLERGDHVIDQLPQEIVSKYNLLPLEIALKAIHFPSQGEQLVAARRRVWFDELLRLQLSIGNMKRFRKVSLAPPLQFQEELTKNFVASLPFQLTLDQRKASWEIIKNLAEANPMSRLLNGDVGSGKTVVAAIALANVIWNKFQGALMAPTEILSKQHFSSLCNFYKNLGFKIALLTTGRMCLFDSGQETIFTGVSGRIELVEMIARGNVDLIIGTHALAQNSLSFYKLGLVVVDEQHRFGVKSRQNLVSKGLGALQPHLLSLTATPIPRTLALSIYGDLDLSLLRELPPNRQPVKTKFVTASERDKFYKLALEEIKKGHQIFVVAPMIEDSDYFETASVERLKLDLEKNFFKTIPLATLHGQLKSAEQEKIMSDFKNGLTKVLLSTTVIEVGVDIPNATVMIIEGAERFGLAGLHQLRGRVGRGHTQAYCWVLTDSKSSLVQERLQFFAQTNDGFALAERDLQTRGAGDILGAVQSGHLNDIFSAGGPAAGGLKLIQETKQLAEAILNNQEYRLSDFNEYLKEGLELAHGE